MVAEQKHIVKVPPMQTLSQAVQAAAAKFKPALVPEHCVLQYNKKSVDLHTPFRLLNIPAGSKLEVIILGEREVSCSMAQQATQRMSQLQPRRVCNERGIECGDIYTNFTEDMVACGLELLLDPASDTCISC